MRIRTFRMSLPMAWRSAIGNVLSQVRTGSLPFSVRYNRAVTSRFGRGNAEGISPVPNLVRGGKPALSPVHRVYGAQGELFAKPRV